MHFNSLPSNQSNFSYVQGVLTVISNSQNASEMKMGARIGSQNSRRLIWKWLMSLGVQMALPLLDPLMNGELEAQRFVWLLNHSSRKYGCKWKVSPSPVNLKWWRTGKQWPVWVIELAFPRTTCAYWCSTGLTNLTRALGSRHVSFATGHDILIENSSVSVMKIMNITPHLPPNIVNVYERNGEVVECIIVRKSSDPEFIRASKACKYNLDTVCGFLINMPKNFDRLFFFKHHINFTQITSETWLNGSGLGCESLITADQVKMNTILDLRYGDDIWLSKRSALPKVGGIPFLKIVLLLL